MMGIYSLHPYLGLALVNNGVDTPAGSQFAKCLGMSEKKLCIDYFHLDLGLASIIIDSETQPEYQHHY